MTAGHDSFRPSLSTGPEGQTMPNDPQSSAPRVSIVIPVFNKLEFTRPCLESLARTLAPGLAEVIVADNGSTDGTLEYLKSLGSAVRVVRNPENLGFARACNLGAREAHAPLVLFLNNDTEAHEPWLEPLVALMDADPRVVAAGSKLLFPDGTIQHAGVMLLDDQHLPDPLVARHVHHGAPGDLPDANVRRAYQALTAACLLVRRAAFLDAGGFDEGYWNGYEDVDLCLELQSRGGLLVYEPASVLTHHESKSGAQRFTGTLANIARLHERWLGRATVDGVVEPGGRFRWSDAARIRDHHVAALDAPAQVAAGRTAGLTSIVMLTWNQLPVTQDCVASIRRHTNEPYELIVVDNGSTDGTVDWLHTEAASHPGMRLVLNARNQGFARGCNQGLAAATGEFVMLLNNDVVVTEGWLAGMRETLERTNGVGFVGPMTNEISGRQKVVPIGYEESLSELDTFAAEWRRRHRYQRVFSPRVVGFCMLSRASLYDAIGRLDETFGTGNYEDDDLCLRAELAGYRNVIAADVFIHHHGSRSFTGNAVDHQTTMTHNRARFAEKWQHPHATDPRGRRVLLLEALEKAHTLDATGRLRDAVELCLEAVRVSPGETTPYLTLACMLVRAGHPKDALDVLQNLPAGLTDARARLLAARAHLAQGHVEGAAHLIETVADEPEVRSRALNLKGLLAHQLGDAETATACFNAAIAADRGYGEPYANLGALLWQRDPGQPAFELLERGFTLSPESPDALEFFVAAAKQLGHAESAAMTVREARGLHPVHRPLTFALIDLLLASGQQALAMGEIENALEWYDVDDGMLRAALAVRAQVGAYTLPEGADTAGTLSVCMITKNEEANIVRAIRSVSPVASEVVVLDTGSSDRTRELAAALGARVESFEWTGDFAAARNAALDLAKGEWVLSLDADEALAARDLSRVLARIVTPGRVSGYVLTTRNYTADSTTAGWSANDGHYGVEQAGTGWYPSRKVRLFKRDPRIRFEGALHEVVDDALRRHQLAVEPLDVPVHHYGPLALEREREKAGAYYDQARRKLETQPEDVQALYELAVQAGAVGKHDEAIALWSRYLERPAAPRTAQAYMNLGRAYLETHQFERAARASREALQRDPDSREAAYNLALGELCRGRYGETLAQCDKLVAADAAHGPAWALLAAAAVLAKDEPRYLRAAQTLDGRNEPVAAALQAHAARLQRAGRGGDVRKLNEAARRAWQHLLAQHGLAASNAAVDELMMKGAGALPTPAERSAA